MKKHGRAWCCYTGHQSLDQQMQSPARCRAAGRLKVRFSFGEISHMNLFLKHTNLLKEPKDWQELRFTQPP